MCSRINLQSVTINNRTEIKDIEHIYCNQANEVTVHHVYGIKKKDNGVHAWIQKVLSEGSNSILTSGFLCGVKGSK